MKDVGLGRLLISGIEKEYVFGVRFVGGVLEENPVTVDNNRDIKTVKNSAIHNNQQFINNISHYFLLPEPLTLISRDIGRHRREGKISGPTSSDTE